MYAYGIKLCGNPGLVQDSIQDVFVTICNQSGGMERIHAIRSYLLTALRRRILELKTSQDRRTSRNIQFTELQDTLCISPEEWIVRRQTDRGRAEIVESLIASLTDRQREAIFLRFYSNLAYEEIARIMQVREQSVRNQIFRVLKTLRKRFQQLDKSIATV